MANAQDAKCLLPREIRAGAEGIFYCSPGLLPGVLTILPYGAYLPSQGDLP